MASSDEALLEAWRAGDEEAGTTLFRAYFVPCRRFFVNKVPAADVDDLLQRTFTAMVESRDRFAGRASFRTYVFAIARRVLMRYLRDYARGGSKLDDDVGLSSLADLAVTPGTAIGLARDQEVVRVALQRIPVGFQTILELSYWEGMPTAELAEILDVEPTTIRTRLFRARKALLAVLRETGMVEVLSVDGIATELGRRL